MSNRVFLGFIALLLLLGIFLGWLLANRPSFSIPALLYVTGIRYSGTYLSDAGACVSKFGVDANQIHIEDEWFCRQLLPMRSFSTESAVRCPPA